MLKLFFVHVVWCPVGSVALIIVYASGVGHGISEVKNIENLQPDLDFFGIIHGF